MILFSEKDSDDRCLRLLNLTAKFCREKRSHNKWEDFKIDTRKLKHNVFLKKETRR